MKMNLKKIIMITGVSLAGATMFAGAQMKGMHGMEDLSAQDLNSRFQRDAKILGVTVDEVKNAWVEGKSIFDLAKDKGISEATLQANMKLAKETEMKAKMAELVNAGVITQAQADKKIANMQTKQAESKQSGKMMKNKKGYRGM